MRSPTIVAATLLLATRLRIDGLAAEGRGTETWK